MRSQSGTGQGLIAYRDPAPPEQRAESSGRHEHRFPNTNYPRNEQFCRVTSSWWNGIGSQAKIQAVYPLPWGLQVSGTFKTLPGIIQTANLVLTNEQVAASLGRNLSSCPAAGVCSATVTVAVVPSGETTSATVSGVLFDLRLNQTDLRLTKTCRHSRGRVQAIAGERPPAYRERSAGAVLLASRYKSEHASLNDKRGSRGNSVLGSPYPRLQRKLDLTCPSGKNS